MGQEHLNPFNCGQLENDKKNEVVGDEVISIRRNLELQKKYSLQVDAIKVATSHKKKSLIISSAQEPPPNSNRYSYAIQHENILRLSESPFDRSYRCNQGFYQQANISLASLIESRYYTSLLFPQEEVLRLLESVLYAISFIQKKGFKHHDLYPTNIFYSNGIFKLSHPSLTTPSYILTLQRKRFSFLSPELIFELRNQTPLPSEHVLRKSDMFALGMIVLEFCSLRPSCECYDKDNYNILTAVIQERLQTVRATYSPRVAESIQLMLEYEAERRIGGQELAKQVNQYANQYQTMMKTRKMVQQGLLAGEGVGLGEAPKRTVQVQRIPQLSQGVQQISQRIITQLQQIQNQQLSLPEPSKKQSPVHKKQSTQSQSQLFSSQHKNKQTPKQENQRQQKSSSAKKSVAHLIKPPSLRLNTPSKSAVQRSARAVSNNQLSSGSNKATNTDLRLKSLQKFDLVRINITMFDKFSETKDTTQINQDKTKETEQKQQPESITSGIQIRQPLVSTSISNTCNTCIKTFNTPQQNSCRKQPTITKISDSGVFTSKTKGDLCDERGKKVLNETRKKIK